jgi:hypothetical protein
MRRFVAASIAMIAVGVAFGMAAERSDLGSCNMTVHRPTREDEERAGVLAKEQRIKKELDELENAVLRIEETLDHFAHSIVAVGIGNQYHENERELAMSKLRFALRAAEERLELFVSQNNITKRPKRPLAFR